MRILSGIVVVAVLVLMVGAAAVAQTATTTVHKYDSFGFSVSLPSTCQPVSLGNLGSGAELYEAFSGNGLAYIILAIRNLPNNMSARTFMNMFSQALSTAMAKNPAVSFHALSATTGQGIPAQGFGMTVTETGKGVGKIPPEVKSMFGSSVYQAAVLVPIVDTPAVLGAIAVVGPADKQGEIMSQVIAVAQTFSLGKPSDAGATISSSSGSRDIMTGTHSKGSKTPVAPPQPDIKPFSELKKGQIELVGVVKSTDSAGKCVDMLVGQAVAFGGHGAILDPPKLKRVYVKEIAEGVKEGVVIIVVAKDTGPGKSVTAGTLTVMDMSKLGL